MAAEVAKSGCAGFVATKADDIRSMAVEVTEATSAGEEKASAGKEKGPPQSTAAGSIAIVRTVGEGRRAVETGVRGAGGGEGRDARRPWRGSGYGI
nr:unnamed protein product [Digitaria exilis]